MTAAPSAAARYPEVMPEKLPEDVSENADLPPLDDCGFVRVPADGDAQLWMTCDQCSKSDHFWLDEEVRCRCGARYDHAIRPDGVSVPVAQLTFVPFKQGPMQLADTEWVPARVVGLVAVAVALVGGLLWWLL